MSALTATTPESPPDLDRATLSQNALVVGSMQSALSNLDTHLSTLPDLMAELADGDRWRAFKFPDMKAPTRYSPADFRRFIEAPRPEGCETPIAVLEQALRGTPGWDTFLELTRGRRGGCHKEGGHNPFGANQFNKEGFNRDVITVEPLESQPEPPATLPISQGRPRIYSEEAPTGTSTSYALRRLKKQAPELLERVKAGEMAPHRALIQAGIRKPVIQVKDDPEALAAYLLRKWDRARVAELLAKLAEAMT